MLGVNQKTYDSTIKRFRHSLQQIEKDRNPKEREVRRGRSLH